MSAILPTPMVTETGLRRWLEASWQAVLALALFSLGFFVLFSTAGTSLSLGALLLLALVAPARLWKQQPWRDPVLAAGLVLLAYVALRTFGDDGWNRAGREAVNHYHELLMAPLVWAMVRLSSRPQAFFRGLVLACLLLSAAHWLVPHVPQLEAPLHSRRISLGFGLAVSAFLLFEHARLRQLHRGFGYAAAAFVAATVFFAYDGRTGHLVLLLLILCAAWRAAPARLRLWAVLATLVASVAIAATSTTVRMRLAETRTELREGNSDTPGSIGSRVELLRISWEVVRQGGVMGVGWHRYPEAFNAVALQRQGRAMQNQTAVNPHNEYLLQLGAGGLPAVLLFGVWLAVPLWQSVRRRQEPACPWQGTVGCLALAFALACAFNSALQDFMEAHLYAGVLAWLLACRRTEA